MKPLSFHLNASLTCLIQHLHQLSIKTVGGLTHQHVVGMLQLDTNIRVARPLEKTTISDQTTRTQWLDHAEGPLLMVRPLG